MRGLAMLTRVELKLFCREPIGLFFTLCFPLLVLFLFGGIYGNEPSLLFGGYGMVDVSVPCYTAMIIATSGLFSLPIPMATYRESGVLRRLQATPLHPLTLLTARVLVIFLMTVLGMVMLVVAARLVYHLHFPGQALNVAGGFLLCCMSFFALGFVLAGLLPTARTAQMTALVLFYPMVFISGATVPREVLPETMYQYSRFLPLTYVVTLLRGLWMGGTWGEFRMETFVLIGLMLCGIIISALTFRWE